MTFDCLPFASTPGACDRCGAGLCGRQRRWCGRACSWWFTENHRWSSARKAARRRDGQKCRRCGSRVRLEVNHIIPRVGAGYGFGCWNHLDSLETLCHVCHVGVTNQQARQRKGKS